MKKYNIANIDTDFNPTDDFYSYATNGWRKANPLKDEFARFGMFDSLRENARLQLKDLITGLANTDEAQIKDSIAQKISDIYNLGMDEKRLNREGAAPLMPIINQIKNLDKNNLADSLGWLHANITTTLFGSGVGPDYVDSNTNVLHISETGLGLGDRDYYLEKNDTNEKILEAYKVYIKKILTLSGYNEEDASRICDTVMEFETLFAENKMTREERRDPTLHHNPFSLSEFKKRFPDFDWQSYFNALDIKPTTINVVNPAYMDFIINFIKSTPVEKLVDFWIFEFISESTGLLSDDFGDASFEMFGKVMSGTKERQPRWKRAMTLPNSMLGEAVGILYVKKYFPESHKEAMKGLVENLRASLAEHISSLPWMTDATKAIALEKLSKMGVKIGYPDKWKDYSEIKIDPEKSYLENVLKASQWYIRDNYNKLGKPVDKDEWHFTPQTVNAYYSPLSNEICFPAAILQPPYFDMDAIPALNYGAIGVVIGHEMTHAFDDQGRQFDVNGNLSDWWQPEDSDKFKQLSDKLVEQFNKVEVADGVYANGRFTLGENIADQGGIRVAYTALRSTKQKKILSKEEMQQFFLSYAGVWAENIRQEEILSRNVSDPHSLGRNRVNETLKNITPFFEAFNILESDKMFRPESERVVIW